MKEPLLEWSLRFSTYIVPVTELVWKPAAVEVAVDEHTGKLVEKNADLRYGYFKITNGRLPNKDQEASLWCGEERAFNFVRCVIDTDFDLLENTGYVGFTGYSDLSDE